MFDLDDEGAQLVAKLLRAVRGPDAVGTTTAECRRITPALLHDIWHVRRWPWQTPKPPVKRVGCHRVARPARAGLPAAVPSLVTTVARVTIFGEGLSTDMVHGGRSACTSNCLQVGIGSRLAEDCSPIHTAESARCVHAACLARVPRTCL